MTARDYNEVTNPEDAWLADHKGKIRAKAKKLKMPWEEIAARANVSLTTVLNVMWEDDMRHTMRTIIRMATVLDVRIATIDGLKTKRQPAELPPLSEKQEKVLRDWAAQILRERKKRKKNNPSE